MQVPDSGTTPSAAPSGASSAASSAATGAVDSSFKVDQPLLWRVSGGDYIDSSTLLMSCDTVSGKTIVEFVDDGVLKTAREALKTDPIAISINDANTKEMLTKVLGTQRSWAEVTDADKYFATIHNPNGGLDLPLLESVNETSSDGTLGGVASQILEWFQNRIGQSSSQTGSLSDELMSGKIDFYLNHPVGQGTATNPQLNFHCKAWPVTKETLDTIQEELIQTKLMYESA